MRPEFPIYLLVMAGVTYLVRMIPLVLIKKQIQNKFILSFLHYIPYAVLAVMTVPAIFYSASFTAAAVLGFAAACITAYFEKGLITVALVACGTVFAAELIMTYFI